MASERLRLDSWKEIAQYLGRDVRTVMRWEQRRGLPVYRVPGGGLSRVFAYGSELDEWLATGGAAEPDAAVVARPQRPRLRAAGAVLALAGAAAAMTWALAGTAAPVQRVAVLGNELRAFDADDRLLWSYPGAERTIFQPEARWSHVADLDGDRRQDVLASVETRQPAVTNHGGELLHFTSDGELRWRQRLDDRFTFRGGRFGPPWPTADLTAFGTGPGARVAWSVHHFTWWPSILATFDAVGRRLGTYVNSGWISGVTPSADGRLLFVGGVTNSRAAYFLAVLDADRPSGRSPEPPGSETECLDCPPGDPLHYVVLPRSDVGRNQPFPLGGPVVQTFEDGSMQVQTIESAGPKIASVIYELGPATEIRRARVSSSFWDWHRTLEADGRLTHEEHACAMHRPLDVQRWNPAVGWQTQRVPVD